jgi:hypothetical protein
MVDPTIGVCTKIEILNKVLFHGKLLALKTSKCIFPAVNALWDFLGSYTPPRTLLTPLWKYVTWNFSHFSDRCP